MAASTTKPSHPPSHALSIKTSRRTQLIDVTAGVERIVADSGVQSGLCHVFVPHTTAGVIVNENDDPDVARDIEAAFDRLAPHDAPYRHREGNADSHIKSALAGVSQTVHIQEGRLALGRWQGIFFCEFDGPRSRQIHVKIVPDKHG